jgi:hypothetical protein
LFWGSGAGAPPRPRGRGTLIFDSEAAAKAASEQIAQPPGGPTTIESIEVFEVLAEA